MINNTTWISGGRVRLHTVTTDKFKMSRFSINLITKSDKINTPLTKLMLAVMLRGSQRYPTVTAINKALDEQYGAAVTLRTTTVGDKSIHKISCKLLKESFVFDGDNSAILENVMGILSDILFSPLKDEKGLLLSNYVESEKRIAIDAINSKINDPKAYASEQCSRYMFEGSEYEVVADGNEELINSFTAEQITERFKAFFSECKVECYYVGDKPHSEVEEIVEKYFPLSGKNTNVPVYGEHAFKSDKQDACYIEDEGDVSQGRLVLGYRCNTVLSDKDYYPMALFNEIFGGSSVSKLFLNVREKKSLCYYCYSSFHTSTGTLKVGCGIDPAKKDDALCEIERQLDAMKRGDITDEEIQTAKHTLISGVRQIKDSPASIEAFMLRRLLADIDEGPEECSERIDNVSKEDIILAASKVELDTVYFMNGCNEYEEGGEDE